MLVGARLRRLRESAGIDRDAAAAAIRASTSKISRMELGRVGLKQRDVSDLLAFYGVRDDSLRHQLLDLAAQSHQPGWWHQYSDVVPGWFEPYLGLEHAATLIRLYQVQFVPDLLQTQDYARAVDRLRHPGASEDELDRRVALLKQRQRLLSREASVKLWAVIDEAALRRPIGGDSVMRKQIEALIEACDQPHIDIQVIPFGRGGHVAAGGAFTVLRFSEPYLPDVVYLEQLITATYLDNQENVSHYRRVMNGLAVEADPSSQTRETLARLLHDLVGPRLTGPQQREPASNVRIPPVDRPGGDRIAGAIYRQARAHAVHSPALAYDVEKGLRRLLGNDEHQDPRN